MAAWMTCSGCAAVAQSASRRSTPWFSPCCPAFWDRLVGLALPRLPLPLWLARLEPDKRSLHEASRKSQLSMLTSE